MLAMAITISCSSDNKDDDDNSGGGGGVIGSCTRDMEEEGSVCREFSDMSASEAKSICQLYALPWSGSKCPSGAGLSCPTEQAGLKWTTHYYGAAADEECDVD